MMKKWICFIMATILCAMALTACGNSKRQQFSGSASEDKVTGWLAGLGF